MTRSQSRPLTALEIQWITLLLTDTNMSMSAIAETMGCSQNSVSVLNLKHCIREYKNQSSSWAAKAAAAGQSLPGQRHRQIVGTSESLGKP